VRFFLVARRAAIEWLKDGTMRGGLLAGDGSDSPPNVRENECLVICQQNGVLTPTAFVVQSSERRDLVAWLGTYQAGYQPISAHFHFLTPELMTLCLEAKPPVLDFSDRCALAGMVLGESVIGRQGGEPISLANCRGTYSFAAGRAITLGLLEAFHAELAGRWDLFVASLGADWRREQQGELTKCASVLRLVLEGNLRQSDPIERAIAVACRDIKLTGEMSRHEFAQLASDLPIPPIGHTESDTTRERRVAVFERTVEPLLRMQGEGSKAACFLLGYLASRLAPGSMEYFKLLQPFEKQFPTSLMWYGICAGLQPGSQVLHRGNFGRRLVRDLEQHLDPFETPTCDVSLIELEQVGLSANPMTRGAFQPPFWVEVVPGVQYCVATREAKQLSLLSSDALSELGELTQRLVRLQQRLSSGHSTPTRDDAKSRFVKYRKPGKARP